MQVYFSTVVRGAPLAQGGEIVKLDWDRKQVLAAAPVVPSDPEVNDPNPRGNTRGGRGIAICGDDVYVANYHSLLQFDRDLRPAGRLSHPLFVGLHEVHGTDDKRMWVAATAIDAAVEVDLVTGDGGRSLWPREQPALQRRLELEPLPIDKLADNRLRYLSSEHLDHASHVHLNAVREHDGQVYGLFNKRGAVVNLTSGEVVVEDPAIFGGHNVVITDDGRLLVNDTHRAAIRVYSFPDGRLLQSLELRRLPWVRRLLLRQRMSALGRAELKPTRMSRPLFLRGLAQVDQHRVLVGVSPASLLLVNLTSGELDDVFGFSRDVRVCVHGISIAA